MKISFYICIIFCLGFSGCITEANPDIIIDDVLFQKASRDSFQFNSVKLINDLFVANMSYGGGCENHSFNLFASSFIESDPVQINSVLSHEDYDEPCDMWITEVVLFDLIPLRTSWQQSYQKTHGTILMNLEGWNEQIRYDF